MNEKEGPCPSRRAFLGTGLGLLAGCGAPPRVPREGQRPQVTDGVQSGDVTAGRGIVWSRSDRLARLVVEWSPVASFSTVNRVEGPVATVDTDFTARVQLRDLPTGRIFYRVRFEPPGSPRDASAPAYGTFRVPPPSRRGGRRETLTRGGDSHADDVLFTWGGDTCGQGWGIDSADGGLRIYTAMARLRPDFFVHAGDMIYADNPMEASVALPSGGLWKNRLTPAVTRVAQTLDDFRGRYRYNLSDPHVRRLHAEVPTFALWDDHEVRNNWFPGQVLTDPRYTERAIDVLAARARRAHWEYTPRAPGDRGSDGSDAPIYRVLRRGPLLDVLLLDERSHRGPNGPNREPSPTAASRYLGEAQLTWLKRSLLESTATWRVVVTDMPLALILEDGGPEGARAYEGWAQGEGPPLGREHELADLLAFLKAQRIRNVIFLTADVHYAAAHHFDPRRAAFRDFDPFWEFVAGPLHAGTFDPKPLDPTFGPEVRFQKAATPERLNLPPSEGLQFFGSVRIDGPTEAMTVTLHERSGAELWSITLEPT